MQQTIEQGVLITNLEIINPFLDRKTKMKFKCPKNHSFELIPTAIINRNFTCVKCAHLDAVTKFRNTDFGFIQTLIKDLKKVDKHKNYENDIDYEWVQLQMQLQNGLCYYSQIPMIMTKEHKYKITVDRLDNSIGHVKENCVLCVSIVNNMKHSMNHDEFLQFVIELKRNRDALPFREYDELIEREKKSITNMMSKMRNPGKRKKPQEKGAQMTAEIFAEIRNKTSDRCAITGIDGSWLPHQWNTLSIDRIDHTKPYAKENCQLTLKYINYAKQDFDICNDEILNAIEKIYYRIQDCSLAKLYTPNDFDVPGYVSKKNGKIIHTSDIDAVDRHMQLTCDKSHKFWSSAVSLEDGIWCPQCKK